MVLNQTIKQRSEIMKKSSLVTSLTLALIGSGLASFASAAEAKTEPKVP
jgi:hypothetical protein